MNSVNWINLLKRLPALAAVLLAAWLVLRIGLTAWEMARLEAPPLSPPPPAAAAGKDRGHPPGSGLFGTPAQRRSNQGGPRPLTDGNFHLRGVVASNDRRIAHAIIESGGVSGAYFAGDAVAAGLNLQEIRSQEVLLRRGSELLSLPLAGLNPGAASGVLRDPGAASGVLRDPGARLDPGNTAGAPAAPPRMTLSQFLRMEPVMDAEGRMTGYRIFPRAQRAAFENAGLASGDLVAAINGVPFDKDNIAQAIQQMNSGGDKMLSIMRDGEQIEITVGSENFGLLAM